MSLAPDFFLTGNYAPWPEEDDYIDIKTTHGEIPHELNGILYRNGPNPQFPCSENHWFTGDGMLHAFEIQNGKISYRNRWIKTERFLLEKSKNKTLFYFANPAKSDPSTHNISHNTANTNIIFHGNKLLALQETSAPVIINPADLSTLGEYHYDGKIPHMTAHPHFDYQTGEMFSFAYEIGTNEVKYYIIDVNGIVTKIQNLTAPFSSFMHDFFITKNYVIFPILPLIFDFQRTAKGLPVLMWEPDKGTHFAIMPRNGSAKDITWFNCESFYTYHFMNAFEKDGCVYLDGCKSLKPGLFPDKDGKIPTLEESAAQLARWCFNLKTKQMSVTQLDATNVEFPRFDERFTGLPYQHGYAAASLKNNDVQSIFDGIVHYDFKNNQHKILELDKSQITSEPVFVPRTKTSVEGEGFLLSVIYDARRDTSDLYIFDAQNIEKDPLAIVQLPHRIPNGFHGNWYSCTPDKVFP